MKNLKFLIFNLTFFILNFALVFAQDIKEPNVAGGFYPADSAELSQLLDNLLSSVNPPQVKGDIFALVLPHAGYVYSGSVASYGYKLIQGKPYKTVVLVGPSHHYAFEGAVVYAEGIFRSPLGNLKIDSDFAKRLLYKDKNIYFEPSFFSKEHSLEVHLPFLQKTLSDFKIVPILTGNCSLADCKKLAELLKAAIGERRDVLVIASSDMYHGYDYDEANAVDYLTLSYMKNMDAPGLYEGLREGRLQLCGGFAVVSTLMLSGELGHKKLDILKHTNSAEVTQNMQKGIWTVGYSSVLIDREEGEGAMLLNAKQKKRLLDIARKTIEGYLKTGRELDLKENDPALIKAWGAFVTLHKDGQLRGCIGNLTSDKPLYLTVRDMAVASAVDDPRFPPVEPGELKDIEIEISVLSPLKKTLSTDEIKLGLHGVLVKKGFRSGVFLPQVATETGWTKEEFLSYLCAHKAGLEPDAWRQKTTEIYTFTAEVFSEKDY